MLYIPRCNCNRWNENWKRFLLEFMYVRGYVMIYPNYPPQDKCYATKLSKKSDRSDLKHSIMKRNGYSCRLSKDYMLLRHNHSMIPLLQDLNVFNIYSEKSSLLLLSYYGDQFIDKIIEKIHLNSKSLAILNSQTDSMKNQKDTTSLQKIHFYSNLNSGKFTHSI